MASAAYYDHGYFHEHEGSGYRLGGSAYKHADPGIERTYDQLRDEARRCYEHKEFDRMRELNQRASDYILRENNAPGRVRDDEIDLHGQFVHEAENILRLRLESARAQHQDHLHVIVGKGNHSPGHIQKIKPAVEKLCQEMGLEERTELNEGRIYINLRPGGGAGGGGGGVYQQGYQPHQQPQYGAQHQGGHPGKPQQQFQSDEEKLEQALIKRCIKSCCTVM